MSVSTFSHFGILWEKSGFLPLTFHKQNKRVGDSLFSETEASRLSVLNLRNLEERNRRISNISDWPKVSGRKSDYATLSELSKIPFPAVYSLVICSVISTISPCLIVMITTFGFLHFGKHLFTLLPPAWTLVVSPHFLGLKSEKTST